MEVSFILIQQQRILFSLSTFSEVSNLKLFSLQFENEVDPKGQQTSHKQTSFFFFRRKAKCMLDEPAAMVIAQTALHQQHINPSWPSILTCDKRGGRQEGGAPFFPNAPHIWVPGHQQALESPRSLGMLYSCRGREKERRKRSVEPER